MSKAVYRRRTKGASGLSKAPPPLSMPLPTQLLAPRETGGEHPVTNSDTQPSTSQKGKIGPCHTSKWDPATPRGIGPCISDGCTCTQETNARLDDSQTRNKSNNETTSLLKCELKHKFVNLLDSELSCTVR